MKFSRPDIMERWFRHLAPVAIVLITLLVFLPALHGGFVWDDDANIVNNPLIREWTWGHLQRIFTTNLTGRYAPLNSLLLTLDFTFWGLNPFGYHLTNLLIHSLNAALLYFLAKRLLELSMPKSISDAGAPLYVGASFTALFFAVHPLRVESAVFASGRTDLLPGTFFLSSLLCYLHAHTKTHAASHRRRWLAASLGAFILSLLSKAVALALPGVLVILDAYPLRRINQGRRVWLEKIPFALAAVVFGAIAVAISYFSNNLASLESQGIPARLAQAAYGLTFYLSRTALPFDISPIHPFPKIFHPFDARFLLGGGIVLCVTAMTLSQRKHRPWIPAAWAYYVVMLTPVLGLVQNGPQFVADRYSYLSCLGWAVLLGAGLTHIWEQRRQGRTSRLVFGAAGGGALLVVTLLGVSTWRYAQTWHDMTTLWSYVAKLNPEGSPYIHANLGNSFMAEGRYDEAAREFEKAFRINPQETKVMYNLGFCLAQQEKFEESIKTLEQFLRLQPDGAFKAHRKMADILAQQGKLTDAIGHYEQALKIDPNSAICHNNLGILLIQTGKLREAQRHFELASRIDPGNPNYSGNLRQVLADISRIKPRRRPPSHR